MRWRTVLAIWILAAAATVAATLAARGGTARTDGGDANVGPRPLVEVAGEPITAGDVTDATAITIVRPDGTRLRFERGGGAGTRIWRQTAPFRHPAQRFSIDETLRAVLESMVLSRTRPDASAGAAALGLDPPVASIEIETASGADGEATLRVELGRAAFGGRAFARAASFASGDAAAIADDAPILVVDRTLHERVAASEPREWLDRRIFTDVAGPESTRIVVEAAGTATELVRDRRTWRMTSPVTTRVDAFARDELLEALGGAASAGFVLEVPDDPAARRDTLGRLGLEPPQGRVIVEGAVTDGTGDAASSDAVRRVLRVGGRTGAGSQDRFGLVEGRPVVVRLPASLLAGLFRPAETIADPTGTAVRIADVAAIEIRRPRRPAPPSPEPDAGGGDREVPAEVAATAEDVRLERDLDAWTIASEAGPRPASTEAVSNLLELLANARATGLELRDHPREHEVAVVVLYGFTGAPLDTVRVAQLPDGRWSLENGDRLLRLFPPSFALPLESGDFAP